MSGIMCLLEIKNQKLQFILKSVIFCENGMESDIALPKLGCLWLFTASFISKLWIITTVLCRDCEAVFYCLHVWIQGYLSKSIVHNQD